MLWLLGAHIEKNGALDSRPELANLKHVKLVYPDTHNTPRQLWKNCNAKC